MAATGTIDDARTQNHQFEPIPPLVFPEQLFLAQFGSGSNDRATRDGARARVCSFTVAPRSESGHSVDAERTHQNDSHRLAIGDGIQQISGSYHGIQKKIGSSPLLAGGKMKNELHAIHGPRGVISVFEIPDAILKASARISSRNSASSFGISARRRTLQRISV